MAKRPSSLDLAAIALDASNAKSLYQQLYDNLRAAVLSRRLAPGTRLPSTRLLASELGVARNTVVTAFEQLIAEGYFESRTGDGTYVSSALPDDMLVVRARETRRAAPAGSPVRLSTLSQDVAAARLGIWGSDADPRPFRPDMLALDQFPVHIWTRLLNRHWRTPAVRLLGYGDPAGYRPLREAIAVYLGAARGVRCTWEQVIVTAGAQQGLDLAVRTLLNPGDTVWMENPGYRGMRGALIAVGAEVAPVPVDRDGLVVEAGIATAPGARAAYVSPSHQYPLGVTMSLPRRLALLDWAKRTQAWLFEDDYDSEYRYTGRPLSSLQGLDTAGRVIYIGTFSKVLFPALRLGYLVAPPNLMEAFTRLRALTDRQSPTIEQAVLANFIEQGHFARHIRRMRALYAERQAALVSSLLANFDDQLAIIAADAGLHVACWLPPGVDDRQVAQATLAQGVETTPISINAVAPLARSGLVLGYAALTTEQIQKGVQMLRQALRPYTTHRHHHIPGAQRQAPGS
jgi:GntR family transcriptional regulator/MocR family aminotransferase